MGEGSGGKCMRGRQDVGDMVSCGKTTREEFCMLTVPCFTKFSVILHKCFLICLL